MFSCILTKAKGIQARLVVQTLLAPLRHKHPPSRATALREKPHLPPLPSVQLLHRAQSIPKHDVDRGCPWRDKVALKISERGGRGGRLAIFEVHVDIEAVVVAGVHPQVVRHFTEETAPVGGAVLSVQVRRSAET